MSTQEPVQRLAEPVTVMGYRTLTTRLRYARGALTAVGVFAVVAIVSNAFELELLGRVQSGEVVSSTEASANDTRQGAVALIQLGLYLLAAIFWIRWMHRAYGNLDAVGRTRRYGEGWAIGGWFVPFLCWWRPKQIANDLWGNESQTLVNCWWGVWLLGVWVSNIAARRVFDDDTIDGLIRANQADIAASVLDVIGVVLAIAVARRITAQLERQLATEEQEAAQRAVATPT